VQISTNARSSAWAQWPVSSFLKRRFSTTTRRRETPLNATARRLAAEGQLVSIPRASFTQWISIRIPDPPQHLGRPDTAPGKYGRRRRATRHLPQNLDARDPLTTYQPQRLTTWLAFIRKKAVQPPRHRVSWGKGSLRACLWAKRVVVIWSIASRILTRESGPDRFRRQSPHFAKHPPADNSALAGPSNRCFRIPAGSSVAVCHREHGTSLRPMPSRRWRAFDPYDALAYPGIRATSYSFASFTTPVLPGKSAFVSTHSPEDYPAPPTQPILTGVRPSKLASEFLFRFRGKPVWVCRRS